MRKILSAFALLLLLVFMFLVQAKTNKEALISLKNITVSPADIVQAGSGIEKVADGNRANDFEMFHTLWAGISKQNITIEADLDGKEKRLDKVILLPRANGENGIIKSADLWIMVKGNYQKIASIEAELSNAPILIELAQKIKNPEKIKLVITDSYGDRNSNRYMVSLGELECVMMAEDAITTAKVLKDSELFSDLTGVALKPDVKRRNINEMKVPALKKLATDIYNDTYRPDSLLIDIHPFLNPETIGKQMRIGNGFSKYEGITGIYLEKGDNIIFVGETEGEEIKLIVPDWTRKPPAGIRPNLDPAGWGLKKEVYNLKEGVNLVHLEKGGNVYIQYFTDNNPDNYPPIKVHFPTGKFNGYFDINRGDTNKDFNKLLKNAVSPILDMRGKYIQVAFPVESLTKYTWGRGVELLQNNDSIVGLQRQFIGWEKEGVLVKNHILARVNYHYYMFRDGDGVAYLNQVMNKVADPESVISGDPCWGFSHEVGHVLQMRPQLTWGGMTEVSNNIMTMFCTTTLGNKSRLSQEKVYEKARNTILDKGISYMDFPGKAGNDTNQYGGSGNTDVFQRLVPFWQLYLYFNEQGYRDFYPDLMIAMRNQAPLGDGDKNKDYLNMLEFCKLACEVSKTDLTEFFQRWGFFYPGEIDVKDYSSYLYQVTQSDVDAVKAAIAKMNLPKPSKDITLMED